MEYFVAQVRTQKEAAFIRLTDHLELPGIRRIFWPRRMLKIRRRGLVKRAEVPVFPGYIFLEGDAISADSYQKLKRLPNFLRFLPDNEDIRPLSSEDKRVVAQLVSHGEVVQPSRVTFDEKSRILVLEGPLKGLEGRITKVDRRKGRAKVKLDLYDDSFEVDFAFESMEKIKPRENER